MTHVISVFGLQNGGELYSRAAKIVGFQIASSELARYRTMTVEQAAHELADFRICYTHGYHQVAPSILDTGYAYDFPYQITFRSTVQPGARCNLTVDGEEVIKTVELFELSGIWRMESIK